LIAKPRRASKPFSRPASTRPVSVTCWLSYGKAIFSCVWLIWKPAGTHTGRQAGEARPRSLRIAPFAQPKITYVFDEANLSLAITADPSLFEASVVDLRLKRPAGIIYDTAPSMFVNYSLSGNDLQSRRRTPVGTGLPRLGSVFAETFSIAAVNVCRTAPGHAS